MSAQETQTASPGLGHYPVVRLKIERRSHHPWIYQKMVEKPDVRLPPGSIVDIVDRTGRWVGRGFYNGHSRIRLRVLTEDPAQHLDESFFARQLQKALALRRDLLQLDRVTDAYRVVHAEGDGLSGLVVDRYADVLVVEFYAAGMYRLRDLLAKLLRQHFPEAQLYWFAEEHVQKQESFDCREPTAPGQVVISEHGIRFQVQPGTRHKTGFFLDQRDNRRALAELCRGQRVLDLCCHSGAFALYAALLGQAAEVTGLDLDEQALALAQANARLNGARVRFIQADLYPWLRDAIAHGKTYDVVVLDPSKQTRSRESLAEACRNYLDMNRLAMQVVSPGGILLTCSCTGLVSEEDFLGVLRRAAQQARRHLQVFRITGAAADHPFLVHVPESRYLKAVWCRVLPSGASTAHAEG
ncbi:MAG: RlmI/RlmK family 23S rRNA methyltransferase [Gemmataceae bacterium]